MRFSLELDSLVHTSVVNIVELLVFIKTCSGKKRFLGCIGSWGGEGRGGGVGPGEGEHKKYAGNRIRLRYLDPQEALHCPLTNLVVTFSNLVI